MDAETANSPEGAEAFVPHAIIQAERRIPSPIFVASLLGPERILRIDFDTSQEPATYLRQALAQMNLKYPGGSLPAFGRIMGLVVNYGPNRAVRFDLEGKALEILPAACRVCGTATLSMKGKPLDGIVSTLP